MTPNIRTVSITGEYMALNHENNSQSIGVPSHVTAWRGGGITEIPNVSQIRHINFYIFTQNNDFQNKCTSQQMNNPTG